MQILIPVDEEHHMKAFVVLRNPHNHPAHLHTKLSVADTRKLETAIQAAGITGLTVQKLLNAPSTVMAYGGGRVADNSPAYVNKRKIPRLRYSQLEQLSGCRILPGIGIG
ncbi:hypothetical protein B0H14DRAFT_2615144 [Mycena olivaceomarginata]|nr:hypothetical protein B0H14DRAFT_2615144 [Mycena olivaceomarginata]